MKKINLLLIISFICTSLLGQTYFQGGIYNDAVWTKQNSPYIITGDVVVFPGKTLVIEPGVEVKFDGFFFLEIRGTLNSIGLDTAKITFTSIPAAPIPEDTNLILNDSAWYGVKIMNAQGAKASFEYSDFSHASVATDVECSNQTGLIYFKHCDFHHNISAINGYTGYKISIDSCNFFNNSYCILLGNKTITNCTFTNNDYGLTWAAAVDVSNSTFSGNNVAAYGVGGLMQNCTFYSNHIAVQRLFNGFEMRNNSIYNNDTALIISDYDVLTYPIKNNKICKNHINVINGTNINIDLTQNCWCSTDSTDIEARLIDGYDDIYLGLINYDIYNDSCDIVLKSVIKVVIIISSDNLINVENEFDVYPNPFDSKLAVDNANAVNIEVFSAQGLSLKRIKGAGYKTIIDVSDLSAGIYFIQVTTTTGVAVKKVIKK
jgi:hypothetical protein